MLHSHNSFITSYFQRKMRYIVTILCLFVFSISVASSLVSEQQKEISSCKSNCVSMRNNSIAVCKQSYNSCNLECDNFPCKINCSKQRSGCLKETNNESISCQKGCKEKYNVKRTCMNGTYNNGDVFTQGCEICKCGTDGRVNCKKDNFCNHNVSLTESQCVTAGGLYHQLCKGPYFSILCTPKKYCLCEGNKEYSCPANYKCVKEFISPTRRQASLREWGTLLGEPLGEIGVCGIDMQNQLK